MVKGVFAAVVVVRSRPIWSREINLIWSSRECWANSGTRFSLLKLIMRCCTLKLSGIE